MRHDIQKIQVSLQTYGPSGAFKGPMGPKALILIGPVTLSEIQGFDKAPGVTTGPNTSPRGPLGLWSIGPINNRVHVA